MTAVSVNPVSWLLASTVAPGSTPPSTSLTVPVMRVVVTSVWASATLANPTVMTAANSAAAHLLSSDLLLPILTLLHTVTGESTKRAGALQVSQIEMFSQSCEDGVKALCLRRIITCPGPSWRIRPSTV